MWPTFTRNTWTPFIQGLFKHCLDHTQPPNPPHPCSRLEQMQICFQKSCSFSLLGAGGIQAVFCLFFWWRRGFIFFEERSSMLSHQKGEHRKGRAESCWLRCWVQEVLTVNSELASSCGMVSQAAQPVTVSLFQFWLLLLENSTHY